jgi:aspartate dehydrogenase
LLKLGIIGCGNIGQFVMRNLGRPEFQAFSLRVVADIPLAEAKLRETAAAYGCAFTTEPLDLARPDANVEVVLECAAPVAAKVYAPAILRSGRSMVVMSVGAFADPAFLETVRQAAEEGNSRLYLPTGGIAGLDHLKAARMSGIQEATLVMIKSPKSLAGAPYFTDHPVDLFAITEPTVIFEGPAAEAIKGFPQNTNVAVSLSLATLGPERTRIQVVCDPRVAEIRFQIRAKAGTGELKIDLVNLQSPDNPRTSYQSCCSALTTLLRLTDRVQLGT